MEAPACWSWDVPPVRSRDEEIERVLAEQVGRPHGHRFDRADIELMMLGDPSGGRMGLFHKRRCAVCGRRPVDGHLVDDHCHATGQIRGYLCRGCNTQEGVSGEPRFIRYRRIHPAAILDVHEMYTGIGWQNGWSLVEMRRDAYRLGVRPATPWPAWERDAPLDAARG